MFNNLKAIRHKQSKYFTIMLIPDSSSKTRSIKIPMLAFYIVLGLILITVATVGISMLTTKYFKDQVYNISIWLEKTNQEKSRLLEESNELSSKLQDEQAKLQNEKASAEKAIRSQSQTFEEHLKYYEDKAAELQEQIDELNQAKEDIYNQISSKAYLPEIDLISNDIFEAQPVFVSMGSPQNSGGLDALDNVYDGLDNQVNQQKLTYNHLLGQIEKIKPYLLNYPTIWPVRGTITSEFSTRANPFTGKGSEFHGAMDISVPTGTSVKATGGGTVTFAGVQSGYGNFVVISHGNGIETMYGHNSKILVSEGQRVERGDIIAKSGNTGRSTGPHVHYEVRVYGVPTNPRNFLN